MSQRRSDIGGETQRRRMVVTGQVQGVGFRPYVYRLARDMRLSGWVLNDPGGVTIEVQGSGEVLDDFTRRLRVELPPLAAITDLQAQPAQVMAGEDSFEILPSVGGELTDAQVTVDTAICDECLAEMRNPADPRYAYPFINCTNCGPRYTIVKSIPYDRPNTTMAHFAMCPLCSGEYGDPSSRRFHAQPVACARCGPAVWLVDPKGRQLASDSAIEVAADMLRVGKIVAIKGLGGFHLACRADNEHVVARLRRRKLRDAKPLAVMVADLAAAERLCELSDEARALLSGPLRPIVICPLASGDGAGEKIAPSVSQGLGTLGIMLAYTPLHHLLFDRGLGPLVMTSGNYHDEPLVKDNDAAVAHMGKIADVLLLHNRDIERRLDDSVVQIHTDGLPAVIRRARGYAPVPIRLESVAADEEAGPRPNILAVGGELKSAVCLLKDGRAVLGEHIGDLRDGRAYRHFISTINHLESLFDVTPDLIVADTHPLYLSSEYAQRRHRGELAGRSAVALMRVQHHHAHIASCLAEHGRSASEKVIGIACDGVGYGDDGAVWGCEILQADLCDYQRLGHLRYISLPGGDAAARQTWRPALGVLFDTFGDSCLERLRACLPAGQGEHEKEFAAAAEMLSLDVNCPATSSLGRWFDAVAFLCGLAEVNRFEGDAPMMLETAVVSGMDDSYGFRLVSVGPFLMDLRPAVEQMTDDLAGGVGADVVAAKFHNTIAAVLHAAALRAREETHLETVALSGGCFANRILTDRLIRALLADGFEVLRHSMVPCNDGGLALGQAAVAAARTNGNGELAQRTQRMQRKS